jgi:hypothetical protein
VNLTLGLDPRPGRGYAKGPASSSPAVEPGGPAVFWTAASHPLYDHFPGDARVSNEVPMVAVIGNVIAGLLALSLFTATVRLTK